MRPASQRDVPPDRRKCRLEASPADVGTGRLSTVNASEFSPGRAKIDAEPNKTRCYHPYRSFSCQSSILFDCSLSDVPTALQYRRPMEQPRFQCPEVKPGNPGWLSCPGCPMQSLLAGRYHLLRCGRMVKTLARSSSARAINASTACSAAAGSRFSIPTHRSRCNDRDLLGP